MDEHEQQDTPVEPDGDTGADDPRGGLQSEAYRSADPRDLVEEGDVVMGGPGGAPQDRDPEAR